MIRRRRTPVGRFVAIAAVLVAIVLITQTTRDHRLETIAPGLEFGVVRGDPYCKRGSSVIAVLRIDPAHAEIRVRHYTLEAGREPPTIVNWLERTGALAVFNAGQYYPDYAYMGLLVSRGSVISARLHPQFKAALVAGRDDGSSFAHVLDLDEQGLDPAAPGWGEVAQSFMLFDGSGTIRIRKSNQIANRTVVGEDRAGRIVVLTTEGAYTLHDLAKVVRKLPFGITHAMSMDGGIEAQMCVRATDVLYASFGHWEVGREPDATGARIPLPAVVTVSAR